MIGVAPPRPARPRSAAAQPTQTPANSVPWIEVAPDAPYFVTERGDAWTPIGQNDSISWIELNGLFRRRDLAGVEQHLCWLRDHGVTVLRLMLECAHQRHRYLERPIGRFVPNMVSLWDDLFGLSEKHGLRILLTPYDTFWTWKRWKHHPLNRKNGGPCARRGQVLLCPDTRAAIKERLSFAVERWGGSGALFAWDLWNEIHPAHAGDSADCFPDVIEDLSSHVRRLEMRLHGRSHLQTVSLFGPELIWKPHLPLTEPIFRHPSLDFASTHLYEHGTIDDPRNTVDPAVSMGRLVRGALGEIRDRRPYLDTEHGPIHTFKDRKKTLPEAFDDEYFRHTQWAHFASGGAGGGMRWPNRHPHALTRGMRQAQQGLTGFLPLIDWTQFRRRNLNQELRVCTPGFAAFACGDDAQAVVWLLRKDRIGSNRMLDANADPVAPRIGIPGLKPGFYRVTAWDTRSGTQRSAWQLCHPAEGPLTLEVPPFVTDLALAIRHLGA